MSKLSAVTLLHSKSLNSCDRLSGWSSQAKHKKQPKSRALRSHARLCETLRDSCWCSRPTLVCWCTGKVRALIGIMSTLTLCEEVHNIRALAMHTFTFYYYFKHEQTCSSYYNSLQAYQLSIEFVSVCFPMCSLWFIDLHGPSWIFIATRSLTGAGCWASTGRPPTLRVVTRKTLAQVRSNSPRFGTTLKTSGWQWEAGKYQKWWIKIEKISCGNCNELKYMKWVLFDSKTTLKHSETTKRVKRVKRVTATGTCSSISSSRKEMNSRGLMPPGARRCKDPIRTRSPIALVVCHVKLDEVIWSPYRSWMSWTFIVHHRPIFPHRSSLLPSFKQLFVSFPLCSHLRCCIDRVMRHQEETLHCIKGCCILLCNARCKKRWFDHSKYHSDIFRLYFLQARTIRTGILPRSIVPFTGAKTSKLFETPIGIRGTKSQKRNRGYQYVSIYFDMFRMYTMYSISWYLLPDWRRSCSQRGEWTAVHPPRTS